MESLVSRLQSFLEEGRGWERRRTNITIEIMPKKSRLSRLNH